jgi:hypothetical protein
VIDITRNSPLVIAILEIEKFHGACLDNECKHKLLVSSLLEYESAVATKIKSEYAQAIKDLRDYWINSKQDQIGDLAIWLKTGFDLAIKEMEK